MPRTKGAVEIDLDVDVPEKVPGALRAMADYLEGTAEAYFESTGELESAWQEQGAGRVWTHFAKRMERLASSLRKAADGAEDDIRKYV